MHPLLVLQILHEVFRPFLKHAEDQHAVNSTCHPPSYHPSTSPVIVCAVLIGHIIVLCEAMHASHLQADAGRAAPPTDMQKQSHAGGMSSAEQGWLTGGKRPFESGGTQQYAAGPHTSRCSLVQQLRVASALPITPNGPVSWLRYCQ